MESQPLESGNAVLQTIHASDGGRAYKLLQERQRRAQELETAKTEIENETKKRRLYNIDEKYTGSTSDALEEAFRQETVGLVSAEEFREKRKRLLEKIEEATVVANTAQSTETRARRQQRRQIEKSKLSFAESDDDDDDDDSAATTSVTLDKDDTTSVSVSVSNCGAIHKDPTDAAREERMRKEKERIIQEYYEEQDRIKEGVLEVTYSYWDDLGHRRVIQIKKGSTIGNFLNECSQSLEKDFPELRSVSTDNLMYIKEDLILPHQVTFYDLIKIKARGKSGPLFNFDVHDDIRMCSDIRIEKDESHAGKIVDRKWYERNKHIFPASRWELYDPSKTYEKYTIHGNNDYSKIIV